MLDMRENAVGFLKRTACRHDVIENESSFIEGGKETGTELAIRKERYSDEQHAKQAEEQRVFERPLYAALIKSNDAAEKAVLRSFVRLFAAPDQTRAQVTCPDQCENQRSQ